MPRAVRHETDALLSEARAIELLADDAEIPPEMLQEYWTLAGDLMNLVVDIEEQQATRPTAAADDPEVIQLRHRLRAIASRLAELTMG